MKLSEVVGYYDEEDFEDLPSAKGITALIPQMVKGVQKVYDAWDVDDYDEYNGGGICHVFADVFVDVLMNNGYEDVTTISASVGEQHVWAVVKTKEGVYEVDIPPGVYETGGGYAWKKIPDVKFDNNDIHVGRLSPDPNDFESQYLEDY